MVARSSIIASIVSTSSYSQAKIKALPRYLQRAAYLKELYPLARDTHPATAMKWCVEATAAMTDDELHTLITSPKELKQRLRAHSKTAKQQDGAHTQPVRRLPESESESIGSESGASDYNEHSGSSDGDESSSEGSSSVVEQGDSDDGSSHSSDDDDDDDDDDDNDDNDENDDDDDGDHDDDDDSGGDNHSFSGNRSGCDDDGDD